MHSMAKGVRRSFSTVGLFSSRSHTEHEGSKLEQNVSSSQQDHELEVSLAGSSSTSQGELSCADACTLAERLLKQLKLIKEGGRVEQHEESHGLYGNLPIVQDQGEMPRVINLEFQKVADDVARLVSDHSSIFLEERQLSFDLDKVVAPTLDEMIERLYPEGIVNLSLEEEMKNSPPVDISHFKKYILPVRRKLTLETESYPAEGTKISVNELSGVLPTYSIFDPRGFAEVEELIKHGCPQSSSTEAEALHVKSTATAVPSYAAEIEPEDDTTEISSSQAETSHALTQKTSSTRSKKAGKTQARPSEKLQTVHEIPKISITQEDIQRFHPSNLQKSNKRTLKFVKNVEQLLRPPPSADAGEDYLPPSVVSRGLFQAALSKANFNLLEHLEQLHDDLYNIPEEVLMDVFDEEIPAPAPSTATLAGLADRTLPRPDSPRPAYGELCDFTQKDELVEGLRQQDGSFARNMDDLAEAAHPTERDVENTRHLVEGDVPRGAIFCDGPARQSGDGHCLNNPLQHEEEADCESIDGGDEGAACGDFPTIPYFHDPEAPLLDEDSCAEGTLEFPSDTQDVALFTDPGRDAQTGQMWPGSPRPAWTQYGSPRPSFLGPSTSADMTEWHGPGWDSQFPVTTPCPPHLHAAAAGLGHGYHEEAVSPI